MTRTPSTQPQSQLQSQPQSPPPPAIEARGLTRRYGGRTVVDDVTFTVAPGRVTGFLGPNGAGKSTTMRLLLGLERPDGGTALINGTLVRHPAGAIALVVGFQFVLPGALSAIPGSLGEHLSGALPAGANVMMGSGHDASNAYSPFQGLLMLLGWTLVLFAAARLSLRKRDV